MDQKFFRVPFASSGDTQTIPDTTASDGSVSYPSGWGEDYAKDPAVDANAKPVEREAMNTVLNAITGAIRQYQTNGYPEWITTADNNGEAYGYAAGVVVDYNGTPYLSLVNNNTTTPGADETKWQEYIQREATEGEAIAGEGSTQVITPRRLHAGASYLDEQLKATLTPYLSSIGEITLWGGAESTIPQGKLRCNGQSFDMELNPILASIYPDGRVPNLDGRYVIGASDANPAGTVREASWEHRHFVGQMNGNSGDQADDVFLPYVSGKTEFTDIGEEMGARGIYGDGRSNSFAWGALPISGKGSILFTGKKPLDLDGDGEAADLHPADTSLYYIIKTDQAESEQGTGAPTAIVITPATVTVNAGTTRQFAGTILPSTSAEGYTIAWSVSDSSLGSIDSNGLYTAMAGQSGTQTVIASLSTGLTTTATVTQRIYLTSIAIGSVPAELVAGNSYALTVTYSPAGYSETVNAASSDTSIATLAADGTLTINSGGTATLTLTGASSGVTVSATITATEEEVQEVYLRIENNLSEIATGGATAQSAARGYMGLGKLATKDALTADDTGAVPVADETLPTGTDLNDITVPGQYFQNLTSNATLALNYPEAVAGVLVVYRTGVDDGGCRQVYMPYNSTVEYRRYAFGAPLVFSAWKAY